MYRSPDGKDVWKLSAFFFSFVFLGGVGGCLLFLALLASLICVHKKIKIKILVLKQHLWTQGEFFWHCPERA